MMNCIWLGQAGLLFNFNGTTVMVDPYLSNSCYEKNKKFVRRFPADESFLKVRPDILILTHSHLDHTDPQTLKLIFENPGSTLVLAAGNAWSTARGLAGSNCVLFNAGTGWTCKNLHFKAVYAAHSDNSAIGVIINFESKNYYITGDTLFHDKVLADITCPIEVVFLPINGVGNNMNAVDAALFAEKIGAKLAVPLHFGLFDEIDPKSFSFANKVIPKPYQVILGQS